MIKHNQVGAISGVVLSLILTVVMLLATIGFAGWAFTSRQDYKDNSDQKAAAAAEVAKEQTRKAKDKEFEQKYKEPFRTYAGPAAYGSLTLQYPRTWSGYVAEAANGSAVVDGYFSPNIVPSASDKNSVFALRIQVLNQPYAQVLQSFTSQQQQGKLTVAAYALPKMPEVVGVLATGQLSDQKTVTMVVLPLRSQTIQIWTEGNQYLEDFNRNILPNVSFSP